MNRIPPSTSCTTTSSSTLPTNPRKRVHSSNNQVQTNQVQKAGQAALDTLATLAATSSIVTSTASSSSSSTPPTELPNKDGVPRQAALGTLATLSTTSSIATSTASSSSSSTPPTELPNKDGVPRHWKIAKTRILSAEETIKKCWAMMNAINAAPQEKTLVTIDRALLDLAFINSREPTSTITGLFQTMCFQKRAESLEQLGLYLEAFQMVEELRIPPFSELRKISSSLASTQLLTSIAIADLKARMAIRLHDHFSPGCGYRIALDSTAENLGVASVGYAKGLVTPGLLGGIATSYKERLELFKQCTPHYLTEAHPNPPNHSSSSSSLSLQSK